VFLASYLPEERRPELSSRDGRGAAKAKKRSPTRRQVAALPYRVNEAGDLEILLLTSRQTRRFIVPKGWRKNGLSESKAAAEEAFEEAGIKGRIEKKPIGSYSYWKRQARLFERVRVNIYALKVTEQRSRWPERKERSISWLRVEDAATLIDEQELATLMRTLEVDASGKLTSHPPESDTHE
jgi:8-oxo-dGTP pyrophosphatase MutT (NUDIX family)